MIVSLRKKNVRRMAVLLVLLAVLAAAWFAMRRTEPAPEAAGATNEERLAYINSFGWTVETEPAEISDVQIPAQFNDVYTAYNTLQKEQGFDLLAYAGRSCTQYKYIVTNYHKETTAYLSLLVCEGHIIGADISSAELGGQMHGLQEHPEDSGGEVSMYGGIHAEESLQSTDESNTAPAG